MPCWCERAAAIWHRLVFDFLPTRATLDIAGWPDIDIFAH